MPKRTAGNLGSTGPAIAPLPIDRYTGTLEKIYAYRQTDGFKKDREKEMIDLYFNVGHDQHTEDGEPVLDDKGNIQTHYIVGGFINFSVYRSNLFDILKAFGFKGAEFIGADGEFRDDVEIDYDFLGEYAGKDFPDLPLYESKGAKREFMVEMAYLKFGRFNLIGRQLMLDVGHKTDSKNRVWNTVDDYISIDGKPISAQAPTPTTKPPKVSSEETDLDELPPVSEKGRVTLIDMLLKAGVANSDFSKAVQHTTSGLSLSMNDLTGTPKGTAMVVYLAAKRVVQGELTLDDIVPPESPWYPKADADDLDDLFSDDDEFPSAEDLPF